jgi:hypothetical protein
MTEEATGNEARRGDAEVAAVEVGAAVDAQQIRQRYFMHETLVQSLGIVCCFQGTIAALIGCIGFFAELITRPGNGSSAMECAFYCLVPGVPLIILGLGMSRLWAWVRLPVAFFAGLGLFHFPWGTLINGYVLYLVFCPKGAMVFSPRYAEIVRQSPPSKFRTSLLFCMVVALLIAMLLMCVMALVAFLAFGR